MVELLFSHLMLVLYFGFYTSYRNVVFAFVLCYNVRTPLVLVRVVVRVSDSTGWSMGGLGFLAIYSCWVKRCVWSNFYRD